MNSIFKKFLVLAFVLSALVFGLTISQAAVPHLINYQGRLTDTSGNPLNGSYNLTFRIYDAETAGNLLWEEVQPAVVIQKGVFSILLGSVTNLNLAFDKPYFLEIKVGTEIMSPRQRIASVGYAIKAETAENADKIKASSSDTTAGYLSEKVDNSTIEMNSNKLQIKGLASSFTTNGYTKLPGGIIIQWGQVNQGEPSSATFPIPFPNGCYQVVLSAGTSSNPGDRNPSTFNITKTGFSYNVGPGEAPGRWIAVGY